MTNVSLIAIPGWVEPFLANTQSPLSVLLDVEKLSSILSKKDVAFYVYCQLLASRKMNPYLIKTFVQPSDNQTPKAIDKIRQHYIEGVSASIDVTIESFSLQNPKDSIRPLYDGQVEDETTAGGTHFTDYNFEVVEVASDVLGFRISPIRNDISREQQELESFDKVLNQLVIYNGFKDTVKTPAMNRFIKLSASRV